MSWFVTGTDTNVGKTWFSRLLVTALRENGVNAAGYKPVACGDREDAKLLAEASGGLTVEEVNPVFLQAAVAPKVAAMLDNSRINPGAIVADCKQFEKRFDTVVVEGAGGWRVPLAEGYDMADLATDIGESKDLASAQPAKVKELQALWDKWSAEQAPASTPDASSGGATKKNKKKKGK